MIQDKIQDNRKRKPLGVKILAPFSVVGAPTSMGTVELVVIGLGDDSKVYRWSGKDEDWFLAV